MKSFIWFGLLVAISGCTLGSDESDTTEGSNEEQALALRRCSRGQTRCSGNGVQICGANGRWGTVVTCAGQQSCVNGACVSVCTPGSTQCSGNSVQICGANGTFGAPVPCVNQCLNGVCVN